MTVGRGVGGTPWGAVRVVARAELRHRWRSMVVVGVLAGLVAAVVGASAAVARRTSTAYDRLAAATHLDDARMLIFSDSMSPDRVTSLPGVLDSWSSSQVIGKLDVPGPVMFLSVSTGDPRPKDLFSPVLVSGRLPHDDDPNEVIVPEVQAEMAHLSVGDELPLKLMTPLEVTQFDTGFGEPDGPRVPLRVVGVYRAPAAWIGDGLNPVLGTPALGRLDRKSVV